jgi:hypothetical protein
VKLKDEYGLEVEKCAVIVIYNVSRYIDKWFIWKKKKISCGNSTFH